MSLKSTNMWQSIDFKGEGTILFQIGPLDLWVRHAENEWRTAVVRTTDDQDRLERIDEASPPDDLEWRRWFLGEDARKLTLCPVMPDRAVIVRPEVPVSIFPGQTTTFFVSVPVFVKICAGEAQTPVCEEPTVVLTNSWFGEVTGGELCYALRTNAHLRMEHLPTHPHHVVCPVRITNQDTVQLEFHRLCLRTQYLDIFQGATHLWTNGSRVVYHGGEKWSKISHEAPPTLLGGEMTPTGKARIEKKENLIMRTFGNFSNPSYH